jgi:hypothetical protein
MARSRSSTAAAVTCSSSVPSGADYLCNTYVIGQQKASWRARTYPLDGVDQHLYIDQGGPPARRRLARMSASWLHRISV